MIEEKFCHVCGHSMLMHFSGGACGEFTGGNDKCPCTERGPYPHASAALSDLLKDYRFKVNPPIVNVTTELVSLKRCPFCGEDAILNTTAGVVYVTCRVCKACGPVYETSLSAINTWNNRYHEDELLYSLGQERDKNAKLHKKVKKMKKKRSGHCLCL